MSATSSNDKSTTRKSPQRRAIFQFLFGGLFPVIGFTVVEEYYGPIWGIITGMAFGLGEMAWEFASTRHVSMITWVSNILILVLGGVSLVSQDGIWFKLQPALIEAAFAFGLIGSVAMGRPLMILLAQKQGQQLTETMTVFFRAVSFRLGVFFLAHAGLATWAAFKWSTTAWALLKGLGLTLSMLVYVFAEFFFLRRKVRRNPTSHPIR